MFKSQGMHVNTELRKSPPKCFSCDVCVVCAVHESCQSVLVCASVFVHFFLCTGGVVKVLLVPACSYTLISVIFLNIFNEWKIQGMQCLFE